MNYIKKSIIVFLLILSYKSVFCQKKYDASKIIDKRYGINFYDKYNYLIGGDSIRNCNNYACSGWVEDYYTNGNLLHKGYYVNGQLKLYKNYYPNGQIERSFRNIDMLKSKMTIYYEDGKVKSEVLYINGSPVKWQDFYPNGKLKYIEQFNRKGEYYLARNSYYEDGTPRSLLQLDNKRKMIYNKTEYYKNGKIKSKGKVHYDEDKWDYLKIGKWQYFDENAILIKEEIYSDGKLVKSTNKN